MWYVPIVESLASLVLVDAFLAQQARRRTVEMLRRQSLGNGDVHTNGI